MVLYARDIMKEYTSMMKEETTASQAAKIMSNDHVGFAIIERDGKPIGMVTEWDFVNKIVSKDLNPKEVLLKDIMNTPLMSVDPKTPTDQVTVLMSKKGVRRLPVIENGKLIGVITSRDVLRIFKDYMDNLSDVIARFGSF
ncbi:MAG: inosine-5'-monophosphate dehydrogenase related protein [Thermoplasmatales archaeon A-plasma]|jgi:CBS domain-containing protein|nr:MAG: inosine-5'-monophosphate dehydrogenase related protein [Thermoplasmatales archaeon A-plasma]MCL5732965.1 CBS domain-containing protein [Candidatus Thermoplasmatota archaeon]WMT44164.1 MAG: CBS domain-containing protein [Cuniculiplasma divulgatum]